MSDLVQDQSIVIDDIDTKIESSRVQVKRGVEALAFARSYRDKLLENKRRLVIILAAIFVFFLIIIIVAFAGSPPLLVPASTTAAVSAGALICSGCITGSAMLLVDLELQAPMVRLRLFRLTSLRRASLGTWTLIGAPMTMLQVPSSDCAGAG